MSKRLVIVLAILATIAAGFYAEDIGNILYTLGTADFRGGIFGLQEDDLFISMLIDIARTIR